MEPESRSMPRKVMAVVKPSSFSIMLLAHSFEFELARSEIIVQVVDDVSEFVIVVEDPLNSSSQLVE